MNLGSVSWLAVAGLVGVVGAGGAQTVPPADGTSATRRHPAVRWQLGASVNNPGLQQTVEVVWTTPLTTSSHPVLAGAHVSGAVVSVTTPAQARLGGWVEYAPLAIAAVRIGFEPGGYFGTFNSVMSFPRYDEDFDRETRNRRGGGTAALGTKAYVSPSLQGRVGPMVARVSADIERWHVSASGPYFYETTRDTLLRNKGDWLLNAATVVMYERRDARGGTLSGGVLHAATRVFDAPGNQSQRLGAILVREVSGRRLRLPNPRATAIVWRYQQDPSKSGQWGAALAIGFHTGR